MKKIIFTAAIAFATIGAHANCTGSESLSHCNDSNGNSYTVQRIGNTTYTNGSNASTGSTWNQTSQQIGSITYHNGTAADGNTWSGTSQHIGNTTYHSGTDSRGRPYSGYSND